MYLLRLIRSCFCRHEFGNGTQAPFVDSRDNHYGKFTCSKCGKNKLVCFDEKK